MSKEEMPWFIAQSPTLGKGFRNFYYAVTEQGVLDKKTRELLMMATACAFRCNYCTEMHLKGALEAGATKEEVTEALFLTALEGAGTQLHWAKATYEKYLGSD